MTETHYCETGATVELETSYDADAQCEIGSCSECNTSFVMFDSEGVEI